MITTEAELFNLYATLLPDGRAFDIKNSYNFRKIFDAVSRLQDDLINDSENVLIGLDPNNEYFTEEQAKKLEKRYGLYINESLDFATRKQRLISRMTAPGDQLAKQHWSYIQKRLRDSGFDVYVHENRFTSSVLGSGYAGTAFAGTAFAGSEGFDYYAINPETTGYTEQCNNYIDVSKDTPPEAFMSTAGTMFAGTAYATDPPVESDDWWKGCFFIGGETFGTLAEVEQTRKNEFRHLILKLKPAHSRAYLLIYYI